MKEAVQWRQWEATRGRLISRLAARAGPHHAPWHTCALEWRPFCLNVCQCQAKQRQELLPNVCSPCQVRPGEQGPHGLQSPRTLSWPATVKNEPGPGLWFLICSLCLAMPTCAQAARGDVRSEDADLYWFSNVTQQNASDGKQPNRWRKSPHMPGNPVIAWKNYENSAMHKSLGVIIF